MEVTGSCNPLHFVPVRGHFPLEELEEAAVFVVLPASSIVSVEAPVELVSICSVGLGELGWFF